MGNVVVYCFKCGSRLLSDDFAEGKAFSFQNKSSCMKCTMTLLSSLPQDQQDHILKKIMAPEEEKKKEGEKEPTPVPADAAKMNRPAADSQRLRSYDNLPPPPPSGSGKAPTSRFVPNTRRSIPTPASNPVAAVAIGIVVILVVILGLMMSRGSSGGPSRPRNPDEPVTTVPPPPAPSPIEPPPKDPKERERERERKIAQAREAQAVASAYARDNPADLPGIIQKFREAMLSAAGTDIESALRTEVAPYEKQLREFCDKAEARVAEKSKKLMDEHRFGEAIAMLEREIASFQDPEWSRRINARIDAVTKDADAQFSIAEKNARMLAEGRRYDDAVKILEPLRSWGLPALTSRIDELIAPWKKLAEGSTPPVKLPDNPVTRTDDAEAAKKAMAEYEKKWDEGARLAFERQYARAAEAQARLASASNPSPVATQAEFDLNAFRGLADLYAEMKTSLAIFKESKQPLEFKFHDAKGAVKSVRGALVTFDGASLEIRDAVKKDSFWIDADWLAAETLIAAHKSGPGKNGAFAKSYALFCLLEGNADEAKRLAGDTASLPERYWEFAKRVTAEKLFRARSAEAEERFKKEAEARALFDKAEKEAKAQPAAAAQKYTQLLEQYGTTAFVKKNHDTIELRASAGREIYLTAADVKSSGGPFSKKDVGGIQAFVCTADHAGTGKPDAFIEFEVNVTPGTPYHIWVLLGGCCQEIASVNIQGDDLSMNNGGTLKPFPIGGNSYLVNGPIASLPATHAQCNKTLQMTWAHVAPWTPSAPVRKIRFYGMKANSAVGGIFVSSKNYLNSPPPEPKEIKK